MASKRVEQAEALERWAGRVAVGDLVEVDLKDLRVIAKLADQRVEVEASLRDAVGVARRAGRSWSMIGVMLGVSKQAAQRKYGAKPAA